LKLIRAIKEELLWLNEFGSFEEAEGRIGAWIEKGYNWLYVHSALLGSGVSKSRRVCSAMGSNTGSHIAGSPDMNQIKATACKPNQMDYSFEKNSISQCEKKCLAFRGLLHLSIFFLDKII